MTAEEYMPLSPRRKSRPVHVGDVQIGGDAPVVVQTMTNTDTAGGRAPAGRTPPPPAIVRGPPAPLTPDIPFDSRLALASIKAGIHGLRLNPGNIRDADKVRECVRAAGERGIPIRIGVNEGSLPPLPPLADGGMPPPKPQRMVDAAPWEIGLLEGMGV